MDDISDPSFIISLPVGLNKFGNGSGRTKGQLEDAKWEPWRVRASIREDVLPESVKCK